MCLMEQLKYLKPLKQLKLHILRLVGILEPPELEWLSMHLSEDGPQGGFRNLLLDWWWLEFWEIIQLAAGDVEGNPGPRRMTGNQQSF